MDAIAYQKKHLIQWQESHSAQIKQASALLAYIPELAFGPYKVSFSVMNITLLQLIRCVPATIRSIKMANTHSILPCSNL